MVFDDERRTMTFPLTALGIDFWRGRRFLTKNEIMYAIQRWNPRPVNPICIRNILCDKLGPSVCQVVPCYHRYHQDIDELVDILAEISLSHGIIYIGSAMGEDSCIGVAETSNHQTNIDADVIDAIVKKIGGSGNGI